MPIKKKREKIQGVNYGKKLIIKQGRYKYFRAEKVSELDANLNFNFDLLLDFIGNQPMYEQYGSNNIGRAYNLIRSKTNELLGLSRKNRVLRTSKREVASLRFYYGPNVAVKYKYVKIPYKLEYIFKAIIIIINEIHMESGDLFSQNMTRELKECLNEKYVTAFCSCHKRAYDEQKNKIPNDNDAQRALDGDFHSSNSALNKHFE